MAELRPPEVDPYFERKKKTKKGVPKTWQVTILTLEQNPPERKFLTYIKIFSQEDFALKSKLRPAKFLLSTPTYFCWQLAFYRHLPTSGRQNTVKTDPQPLFVNRAFVALYVSIISLVEPIPILLFVFELEAE